MFLKNSNARKLISVNPVVLLTTLDEEENPNAMTAAWVTPVSFDPSLLMIAVHEDRYSMENLKETGEEKGFVINVPNKEIVEETFALGTKSGRKIDDKIDQEGLSLKDSKEIEVPKIKECVGWIECKVEDKVKEGDHYLIIGKPVSVEVKANLWEGKFLANKAEVFHHLGGNEFLCNGEAIEVELD